MLATAQLTLAILPLFLVATVSGERGIQWRTWTVDFINRKEGQALILNYVNLNELQIEVIASGTISLNYLQIQLVRDDDGTILETFVDDEFFGSSFGIASGTTEKEYGGNYKFNPWDTGTNQAPHANGTRVTNAVDDKSTFGLDRLQHPFPYEKRDSADLPEVASRFWQINRFRRPSIGKPKMAKTYYETESGRILFRSMSGNTLPDRHMSAIAGFYDPATTYIVNDEPVQRQAINYTIDKPVITANGAEVATVSGLPNGATVYYCSQEYSTTAGTFTFDAVSPGYYKFVIDEVAYLKTVIEIEAT